MRSLGFTWYGLQSTAGGVERVGAGGERRQSRRGGAARASAGCQAGRHARAHTGSKRVNHCKHRQVVLCKDTNKVSRHTCRDNSSMTLGQSRTSGWGSYSMANDTGKFSMRVLLCISSDRNLAQHIFLDQMFLGSEVSQPPPWLC